MRVREAREKGGTSVSPTGHSGEWVESPEFVPLTDEEAGL